MWYLIIYVACAVWVFFDAGKRKNNRVLWPLATAILGPIILPIYFAKRNLREGEVREGGTAWIILKNFALLWTVTMLAAGIAGLIGAGGAIEQTANEYEQAGAAIGTVLGLGMIAGIWFIVLVGALVLGLFLKKSSVIERGPTGPLAEASSAEQVDE
jgi:hypothetical protein